MKKISFIVSLLFIATALFAGPKYDAVYHLISKSYTLNEDGSMDYHFRKELQLFTYSSFDKYGETFIMYNTEWQTLTINEAYTVRKDGSKVQTPANAFNPMLPYSCTHCERFNTIREMVVTHTALENEATIVLDYTIHSQQPFFQDLWEDIELYEDAPIDKYEVVVTLPKNKSLNAEIYLDFQKDTVNPNSELTTTQWIFSHLPQKPKDDYLSPNYLSNFTLNTVGSVTDFVQKICYQNAFIDNPKDLYKDVLEDILKGKTTDMDKILAVRDYIVDNIYTNDLPMCYMNYIVASPSTIWKTNCATPFEKNVLFKSMLEAIGYKPTFGVFINNMSESALEIILNDQNYYITAAYKHQKSLILRPEDAFVSSSQIWSSGFQDNVQINMSADVAVNRCAEGLSATVTDVNGFALSDKDANLQPNPNRHVAADVKSLSGKYYRLHLMGSPDGCPIRAANISRQRTVPVRVPNTNESYCYTITLPFDVDCISKPYVVELSCDFGSVKMEMEVKENTIIVRRALYLNSSVISKKKQIKQLRRMMGEWNIERDIMLTKNYRVHEINVIYDL